MLPKVKVIKKSQHPIIEIRILNKDVNNTFSWILEKENGSYDEGKFIASNLKRVDEQSLDNKTFTRLEFNIPLNFELGYYTFKIFHKQNFSCKLIVVPEKCFVPEAILKNKKIFGPKINLSRINLKGEDKFPNIKSIIKTLSDYGVDILSLDSINQIFITENETLPHMPSCRLFFDIFSLNIEDIMKFIEDKELQVKFLSQEFQKQYEELEKKDLEYKELLDIKFKKYKLLYESFKENHIKNNTSKAKMFYNYVAKLGMGLHKLALFEALQDSLSSESDKYKNWNEWPEIYKESSEEILKFEKTNNELIEFYKFLQWQADIQFKALGQVSYEKKLGIGVYTDFKFCIDKNAAEIWAYRDYFSDNTAIKIQTEDELEEVNCPALLPQKLIESAYSYFIDLIRPNMLYSGALKLQNIEYILQPEWMITNESEKIFKAEYPVEDLLGIIALESQRNKCMITANIDSLNDNNKELLNKLKIFEEKIFEIKEIEDYSQLNEYFEKLEKTYTKLNLDYNIRTARIPNSTYRLQFNKDFSFNDAKEIIPYLKKLGISHIYSSPLLSPRKGSPHGYDVIGYDKINQEAGTFEEFNSFVETLHANSMGLIFDVVPNHMGICKENVWWMDVLENGQSSQYAHYFDIDWNPIKKELQRKVLLPVLGDHYGKVLANGQINFSLDVNIGKLFANYYEHKFPLDPSSYPAILEHRIEVLKTRLGSSNKDFQEYLSINTVFRNLPIYTTKYEKIDERIREKSLAFERLASICSQNYLIKAFIEENLIEFQCSPDNTIPLERVHNLLEKQPYRLAFWRVSADEINYRRFFDINDLAAICVEHPDVFANTHSLILELIEHKKIDGLRIDHPDGLLEPADYFKTLQSEIAKKNGVDFDANKNELLCSEKLPFYIIAEKILGTTEQIPQNWAIHGSVGYDFLNQVNELFVKFDNKKIFTDFYYRFIQKEINFSETAIECKKLIMNTSLAAELNVLSNYLNQISEMYLFSRDYTLNSLRTALIELIACFPVYRTYISSNEIDLKSQDYIKWAISLAKKRSLTTDVLIFDFIQRILLLEIEEDINSKRYKDVLNFTLKFQQYTGPLMAKGFEDTSFYRYNRLISLNEVGSDPNSFGVSVDDFHEQNLYRMDFIPNTMLTTSTHDTKRSEDVRSRINAISEFPIEWKKLVRKLHLINKNNDDSENVINIGKNDEYLIYQSLVGIWDIEKFNDKNIKSLSSRLENYILKAVREAKTNTSWLNVNSEYEQAVSNFIRQIFEYPKGHIFWKTFLPFQNSISNVGYLNSISQCVLKFTSPGVPDIYQGNEIFKFSLVDPDNRRPVNYSKANECFKTIQPLINFNPETDNIELFKQILLPLNSGAIKLFYTTTILNLRNQNPSLFKLGTYIPLNITGKNASHFIAFARLLENQALMVIVPRLISNLISKNPLQLDKEMLEGTVINIPKELENFNWIDICTKSKLPIDESILLCDAFNTLPAVVLYGIK